MGELVTGDGVGEASGDLSLHLRLSFACEPRTRMFLNSSLESQAFLMRASTGNSNLFPVDARITKAWDSRDELWDMRVRRREGDRTRPR